MKPERDFFPFRLILFISLVYTLVFPLVPMANPVRPRAQETENGMGGGLAPEQLELLGIPEMFEYSRPRLLVFDSYRVKRGDTISEIAVSMGLNEDTLLSINEKKNSRLLQID